MAKQPVPAAMAAAKASSGKMAGRPPGPRRTIGSPTGNVLIPCVLIVLAVFSFPSFLLFCFGMVPSAVAYVIDRHRRWALTITVLAPNLVATTIFIIKMLMDGASVNAVMDLMANPFVWCLVYMSAGMGWAIYFCMPMLVTQAKEYRLGLQRAGYEDTIKALREEWGEEIEPPPAPEPTPKQQQRRR